MKIKLISPRMSLRSMDTELKRRMSPSLSLVCIASLTPRQHTIAIEDENLKEINFSEKVDVVGINVNVDTSSRAFEIAKKFRSEGVKVVFGGIHASACPYEMLPHCDAVCVGEAEELWPLILDDIEKNNLQKIYQNSSPVDMGKYPVPEWNFIRKSKYLYHNIVITSRGCPFKCEFCYNSCSYVSSKYRNRPLNEVLKEIKSHRTRQIMFIDDNLIGNLDWFNKFIEAITPLKLLWHGAVSTNLVYHEELINKMAKSGCRSLFIGFESINNNSLSSVNKKQNNIGNYEKLICMLHSKRIMVNASLVFGFDSDSLRVFPETLNWLVKNRVETMTAHILTPYPGTKLYKRLKDENRIVDENSYHYNTSHVVFQPKMMTAQELKQGYLWMYKRFYSFRNIIERLPEDIYMWMPYLLFNFGYRKFGKLTAFIGKTGLMNVISRLARRLSYGIG